MTPASKANVALIQEALRENGFYAFEADGKFGDNTVSAIKAAQRKYGFIENGIADLRLMESLSGKKRRRAKPPGRRNRRRIDL